MAVPGWVLPHHRLLGTCSCSARETPALQAMYLSTKAWQNINNIFTNSALQLVLHIPLYSPVPAWPAHVPHRCTAPLSQFIPVAILCCRCLMPTALLCRKRVSNFSAQYLPSPKPGRQLWECNCRAEKNEHCITAAINTGLFLFYSTYSIETP